MDHPVRVLITRVRTPLYIIVAYLLCNRSRLHSRARAPSSKTASDGVRRSPYQSAVVAAAAATSAETGFSSPTGIVLCLASVTHFCGTARLPATGNPGVGQTADSPRDVRSKNGDQAHLFCKDGTCFWRRLRVNTLATVLNERPKHIEMYLF